MKRTLVGNPRAVTSCLMALVLALVVGGSAAAAQEATVDLSTTMGRGRACTQWFYDREFSKIEALGMTPAVTDAIASVGGLDGFRDTVESQLGAEVEVVDEAETKEQGLDVYTRTARFEKFAGDIGVQWVFDADGKLAGFGIRPKQ